jgi:hypothetical protein
MAGTPATISCPAFDTRGKSAMRKTTIVLAAVWLAAGAIAADNPQDAKPDKPIAASGVLTENKNNVASIWVDGDNAPTKFALPDNFDKNTFGFPPKGKGVFVPDRVDFTFIQGNDDNKVLVMRRARTPMRGSVTGEVEFSNDFWVAVKPKNGPLDGYAISWPPGDMVARLKALKKGDRVTIAFHTDVERHRIESMKVLPPAPTTKPSPPPADSRAEQSVNNQSLGGKRVFPADDEWNRDVSKEPVDPDSAALIASIGLRRSVHPDFGTLYNGVPWGIPYVVVSGKQKPVPVEFDYKDESDLGPYPIPPDAPIEGGVASTGDRHVLVVDRDNWKLYELWSASPIDGGASWKAGSGAIFDLKNGNTRPAGWTSADAAGLPILPGLVRYDEVVEQGSIPHALRFTIVHSRRAYIAPAKHFASQSNDPHLPPMGMRVRLKANFDLSSFPPTARVILVALKKYGMIVADNGGNWFISGAPDPRWNDDEIDTLKRVKGGDFEVVRMGEMVKQ